MNSSLAVLVPSCVQTQCDNSNLFSRYPPELVRQHKEGLRDALYRGNKILAAGGSALDAVVAAVASMEGSFHQTGQFEGRDD